MTTVQIPPDFRLLDGWPSLASVVSTGVQVADARGRLVDALGQMPGDQYRMLERWWGGTYLGTVAVPLVLLDVAVLAAEGPARDQLEQLRREAHEHLLVLLADELGARVSL